MFLKCILKRQIQKSIPPFSNNFFMLFLKKVIHKSESSNAFYRSCWQRVTECSQWLENVRSWGSWYHIPICQSFIFQSNVHSRIISRIWCQVRVSWCMSFHWEASAMEIFWTKTCQQIFSHHHVNYLNTKEPPVHLT